MIWFKNLKTNLIACTVLVVEVEKSEEGLSSTFSLIKWLHKCIFNITGLAAIIYW
jgi:hypothetical protein